MLLKRMLICFSCFRSFNIFISNVFQGSRRSLQGYSLHIVEYCAGSAQLVASARVTRPTVNQLGHWGAMSCRLLRRVLVDNHEAAMIRSTTQCNFTRNIIVRRKKGSNKRTISFVSQLDCFFV